MADEPTPFSADVINRHAPALSATSDTPITQAAPPISEERNTPAADATDKPTAAAEVKPEEPGATAAPTPPPSATDPAASTEPDGTTAQPEKGLAKRMSELTNARKAADARADGLAAGLERAIEALEKVAGAKTAEQATEAAAADPRPDRTTFDDPNKYDDALVEWSARQATRVFKAETDKQTAADKLAADAESAKTKQTETLDSMKTAYQAHTEKAKERYPDFADVAEADDVQITEPMAYAIMDAGELGPDISYYLGKHPDEAARIAALPTLGKQIYEMGKIAAKVAEAVKPVASKAPPPIVPITGRTNNLPKTAAEETMDEYAARRTAELHAERRRVPH